METASYKLKPLEEYGISPKTGFLPSKPPLQRLQNNYFAPWEDIMNNFQELLYSRKLREKVHNLPLLDYKQLKSVEEYRRAFSLLCFISHGYVWGHYEQAKDILPSSLAIPWEGISNYLGMRPVFCHPAAVLWNHRLLDNDKERYLSNLTLINTFTGLYDETWFFLISVSIENTGAPCLLHIVNAIDNIHHARYDQLILNLDGIGRTIEKMNKDLRRMYEKCDPEVFYWRIRTFVAGSENMASAGLPHGLIYEGVDQNVYRQYAGGSAAQSSLIAALDVAFGVDHHKTSETFRPKQGKTRVHQNAYLREMRNYVPRTHRQFLEDLEMATNIRSYMFQLLENDKQDTLSQVEKDVVRAYNNCLHQLKLFRDTHIQIVTRYVVIPARRNLDPRNEKQIADDNSHATLYDDGRNLDIKIKSATKSMDQSQSSHSGLARLISSDKLVVGAGGTNIIPFLKQLRDETVEAKID